MSFPKRRVYGGIIANLKRRRVNGVRLNSTYNSNIYLEDITHAVSRPNSNPGHIEEEREMLPFTPLRSVRWKDMGKNKDL
jgi:hypothetical protein